MSGIPKGYKKTEVGVIPEDWDVKRLGDLTTSTTGGTPSTNVLEYWGGSIPWMSSGDLHLKQIYNVNGRITQIGLENSSAHIIPKNCVLIGLAGQGKTRGTAAINRIPLCTNQSIGAILPKNTFSSDYLFYVIDSMYEHLRSLSSGDGGRGGLNLNILNHIVVSLPNFTEQKAIAEVLSDMDALIEAQKELIAKKRYIKQGTMEDLLSGRVRLPGYETKGWKHTDIGDIPNDWEVSQIGKIADIISGGTPKTTEKSFWNGTILWCTPTDITRTSGRYIENTEKTITDNGLKNSSAILLPINSLLLCSRATVGDVRIAKHEITTNQGFKSLVCNSSAYYLFIYYLIPFLKPKMLEKSYGSTFLEISKSNLASIQIQLPSYVEQQAIAEVFSDMDDEIETLEAELKKLNHMKRGMMQELLTGRIRLI
ncbi:restriction endonuclease subunit S [Akkermansia muciniphila]|nr:restriction endonuclease subunit S [Akkermansia muciniphila]